MRDNDALVNFVKRVFFGVEPRDFERERRAAREAEKRERTARREADDAEGGENEDDSREAEDSYECSYNAPYDFLVAVGDLDSDWDCYTDPESAADELSATYEQAWL
jgi:hypothetical protein